MPVWDPEIEIVFKHTGAQGNGVKWVSDTYYETAPDEVLEVYRIEVIPPVDAATGRIKKLKYVTLQIGGKEYEDLKINSVMMPVEKPDSPNVAIDIGVPYLWRPITGRLPTAAEATCPKVPRSTRLQVVTVAGEDISEDYSIVVKCARVKGAAKLLEVVGTATVDASFVLDTDSYTKSVTVAPETWDELPGGLNQAKPQIFPWVTYAVNNVATTANQWFAFDYETKTVAESWMDLSWNLYEKADAYLVKALGVIPHANSKSLRLNVVGREIVPEFTIRPLPERNWFPPALYYDTSLNNTLPGKLGPKFLAKPYLYHGVKGGIEIVDNGTPIPAGGIELHVYGVHFKLRG